MTRDRKVTWGSVDPRTDMVTDGLDESADDDDMLGPSQQEMSHLLEDMAILVSDVEEEIRGLCWTLLSPFGGN